MADRSAIEWTDASWNPVRAKRELADGTVLTGWHCTHKSEGCRLCYAESINRRLGTKLAYKPGYEAEIEIYLDQATLLQPLTWRRPRTIFPGSMTDLAAEFVTDEMLDSIFAVAALTPRHRYQFLSKRPDRFRRYIEDAPRRENLHRIIAALRTDRRAVGPLPHLDGGETWWPLANVWIGTSVEDQKQAHRRIPDLLATPAAVRFLSCEPLLGPVDLMPWLDPTGACCGGGDFSRCRDCPADAEWRQLNADERGYHDALHWVICGGESGPNARPMHPDWARSLREQCGEAGVPFFFKQWGEWLIQGLVDPTARNVRAYPTRLLDEGTSGPFLRVGKKAAGRRLDGVEHNAMPQVPA